MDGQITANFTWKEVLASDTADKLVREGKLTREQTLPNEEQRKNIQFLFDKVIQPIRIAYGKPLKINSVFRAPAVNELIGGAKKSDHMCAGGTAACDLEPTDASLGEDFALWVLKNRKNFPIKQMIIEMLGANNSFSWQHISTDRLDNTPDYSLLIAVKENGVTVYKPATDDVLKRFKIDGVM